MLKGLCPKCSQGSIAKSRIEIKQKCDSCGLHFIEKSGDGWAFLLLLDRGIFIFPIIVAFYFGLSIKLVFGLFIVIFFLFIGFTAERLGVSLAIEYWIREGRKINKTAKIE